MTKCWFCMKRIWSWQEADDWSTDLHQKCGDWIDENVTFKPIDQGPIKGRTTTMILIDETMEHKEEK